MNYRKSRLKQSPFTASKFSQSCLQPLLPNQKTKTKKQRLQDSIEGFVQIYEQYLKMLFGQEITFQNEKQINPKVQLFQQDEDAYEEFDLPETVISLINPDTIPDDFEYPLKQVEYFEQIVKSLIIDEKSIHDKLFLKAIENVFANLTDRKFYSLFELRTRGVETQPNQNRNTLIGCGTGQQLFQKSPDRSPRSIILDDNHNQENKTEVFPIYENVDSVNKLVRKFRNYLKDHVSRNQGSLANVIDLIQVDLQSLLYISKKAYSQGEYLKTQGRVWYRTNNDTQDLLTLTRNILIVQFSRKGYNVKPVLSKDGSKIYLLLYIPEKSLEVAAENFGLQKKLSFCFTDLLSLEPVDNEFRPLRLSGRLWRPDEYNLSPYLKYLRPLIIDQIQKINFKKVAREVGQSGLNTELFEYEKSEMYGDEYGPTDEEWTAYYKYLVHLNNNVQIQRQKFQINNDIALVINEQKTAEQIYAIRNHQKFKYFALSTTEEQEKIEKIYDQIRELSSQYKTLPIFSKIPKIKKIKLLLQQQLAHNYLNIFKEALKVANTPKQYLKSLWDRNNYSPFELFIPFKVHFNNSSLKQQAKFQIKWCRYIKNEKNQITLFPSHERLKLSQQLITSSLNLNTLINLKLVNSLFCLHDNYELFGHCNSLQQALSEEKDCYKKKPFDLAGEWIFNFKNPWSLPIEYICSYFGEKIGLYFEFSAYYIKFYGFLSLIGIIYTIFTYISKFYDEDVYTGIISSFSILLIHWSSFVTDYWNQMQETFNIKYGQNKNAKESFIRTAFKGKHIRSIGNDQLNSQEAIHSEIIKRIIISVSVLIFLIGSDIGVIIGLYFFNLFLKALLDQAGNQFQCLEVIISGSLNYGIQYLIDSYYEQIATILTDFENYQTSRQYETSYIMKKYTLYWFSQLFPLMIVCFLHSPLSLYCEEDNCKQQVQYLFGTTICWIFLAQVMKFVKLFLQEQKNSKTSKQQSLNLSLIQFIEEQEQKPPFQNSQEKYGIINEYMEFFLLLALINLFGCLFPFSITLFWIWIIIQFQIQKYRLLYQIQRPWPKGDGSLGIWQEINQLINFVTLLCNSGLICIYYYGKLQDKVILLFLPLLFYNFFVKYMTMSLFGGIPTILEQIMRRGHYLFKNNVQITTSLSRASEENNKNQLQHCPLYKIFGSVGIQSSDHFETISSDNEITDYQLKNSEAISKKILKEEDELQQKLNELTQKSETQNQLYTPNNTQRKIQTEVSEQISRTIFSCYKENNNKQETYLKKKQQVKIKELIKKINQVEQLDYGFFLNYFSKRTTNYAFQIQYSNVSEKQLKRDRTRIWRFFFRLILLSSYKLIWGDYRFFLCQSYIQRKKKIFQNLDYKRFKILSESFNSQLEFYKNKATLKFRRQLKQFGKSLTPEEEKEYEEILIKYRNYVQKKSWLSCRKVQIFRYKGLFFRGFRKQIIKKPSIKFALEYYEAMKKLEQVKFESDIHKRFTTLVHYSSINQYTLNSFLELFVMLEYEQKQIFEFPSINGTIKQKYYYLQPLKSEIYKNVIDKSKDTYIFEQYSTKLEEYILQYCIDEWNQIPNIKLKKHLHDILWIVQIEEEEYLMQFFQVRHGQKLTFQQFHDDNLGVFLAESKNYIKLLNILDQIDDFFIKGYCVSLYQVKDCKSLFQVLQFRKKYSLQYTNEELQQFLFANLTLMMKKQIQNVSIYNYILIKNQYMILNSIQGKNNQVTSLVQMVIEMILLKPIENLQEEIGSLEHPLRYFLLEILQNEQNPELIFEQMTMQKQFIEIDFQLAPVSKEHSYSLYMENMKHQINFHLRMKQFHRVIVLIHEVENFIKINHYNIQEDMLTHFINQFSKNLNYILKSNEIKRILDILLIYYFKISALFALKKDFETEISKLIEGLKKSSAQIRILFRQLSLNIKLENLSEIEQHIILKRRIKHKNDGQSSISSFERLNLINTLRKNQDYILILIQYQTQLQRYLNQFQTIQAIQQYFNKNFLLAAIHYSDIIQSQELLISREPTPKLLDIPLDHSPGLINLEQSSPIDDDHFISENLDTKIDVLTEGDKLYLTQLIYFKFLQMINLYDSKNERFQEYYKQFNEAEGVYKSIYTFYLNQLKLLNQEKISKNDQQQELKCDVGKYQVIMQLRWNDIGRKKQLQLIQTDDEDFIKFQIMMFSNLKITLENRLIIQNQIDNVNSKNVDTYFCIYQIRLIQQMFHLDNLQPVTHTLPQHCSYKHFRQTKKLTKIELLKEFHKNLKIKDEHWFYHPGLEEFQVFYYLSICFSFSPKHIENFHTQNNSLINKAKLGIKQFEPNPKFYCQALKFAQINNECVDNLVFDTSLGKFQQYQLFCQFLNCNVKFYQKLRNSYEQIQENLNDDFFSSILVLGLLHSFLYIQQYDVVDLMYQLISRLLQSQAFIFHKIHQGFEKDLTIVECIFKDNSTYLPAPSKYLFEYTNSFLYFDDIKFNSQYLLFNLMMNQDYLLIQEIIKESILQLKKQPQLIRIMHLFESLLDAVTAMIGYEEPKQQYIFRLNDYTEGTLMHALLAHLQCKYYMNLIDYENALKYSEIILQYINTYMKQEKTIVSLFNNQLVYIIQSQISEYKTISELDELKIKDYEFLCDETMDQDYIHLFNKDLINEAILNHLRILINVEQNLPNINFLFSLQLQLENKNHTNYLQMIYAMYFNFLQNNHNSQLQLLLTDQSNQIDKIKYRIKNEETKQQVYFSLKMNLLSDITAIDQKLKVLDFQLGIFQGAKNGLSQKLIITWTILCAQNTIDGYSKVISVNNNILHPYVSMMYLIQCQSYQRLNQILKAQTMLDLAEAGLKGWFDDHKHPLKALFFFYQGSQDRWLYNQYLICIQEILCLREFDKFEIVLIVQGLIYKEKQLLKAFDYYHSNLLKNITNYLANYVFSQIGKHQKQDIEKKFKPQDAQSILDDLVESSSIKSLNGVTQYLDVIQSLQIRHQQYLMHLKQNTNVLILYGEQLWKINETRRRMKMLHLTLKAIKKLFYKINIYHILSFK